MNIHTPPLRPCYTMLDVNFSVNLIYQTSLQCFMNICCYKTQNVEPKVNFYPKNCSGMSYPKRTILLTEL